MSTYTTCVLEVRKVLELDTNGAIRESIDCTIGLAWVPHANNRAFVVEDPDQIFVANASSVKLGNDKHDYVTESAQLKSPNG